MAWNFKHVVCVEGDVESVRSLRANLDASGVRNAPIVPHAISDERKTLFFGPNADPRHVQALNDSTSQLKAAPTSALDYAVTTIVLADVPMLDDVAFVKCDIEGGEEDVLADMLRFSKARRVPVLISFHLPWWRDKDVARFAPMFIGATCRDDETLGVVDPCDHVARRGFCALLVEYESA